MTPSGNEGLSRRLADHLAAVGRDPPPRPALDAARRSLTDAWGVSLGATGLGEGVTPFYELAREGGHGACLLIGRRGGVTPLSAALANGALAHALDYEDVLDGAPIHPNAAAVPAALAAAAIRGECSGAILLSGLAAGCDLACRLGRALRVNPDDFGFYPPPILGAFAAAAAAAVILQLEVDQVLSALALTLSQATATAQFKTSPQSDVRAVRDAFAAHAGLLATLLARKGVRGFEAPIEGPAGLFALYARGAYTPEVITADLGERWYGVEVSYKPWPACRGTHAFIEAALELRQALTLAPHEVDAAHATGGPVQIMLAEPRAQKLAPLRAIDAKFSLPFTVALALTHGEVALKHFAVDALDDPQVLALARRVRFTADPARSLADASSGVLELEARGRVHRLEVNTPLGHPTHPLDEAALERKFRDCAAYAAEPLAAADLDTLVTQLQDTSSLRNLNTTLLAV